MNEKEKCGECGQTIYTLSSLNRGLAKTMNNISKFLQKKEGNVFHPEKELLAKSFITANQRGNISHLGNHGLIAKHQEPGNWVLTTKGMSFLENTPVKKVAIIQKATKTTIGYQEEEVTMQQLLTGSGEYWEQPGFRIQEGQIISTRKPTQSSLL